MVALRGSLGLVSKKDSFRPNTFDITEKSFTDLFTDSDHSGVFVRALSIAVIDSVISNHENFEKAFRRICFAYQLSDRDFRFVRLLSLTTLRNHGLIRDITNQLIKYQPDHKYAKLLLRGLEIGFVQIFLLKTKAYAAVSTAVRLVEILGIPKLSGFTNAVLRNAIRNVDNISYDDQQKASLNTPSWLWDIWVNAYGEEKAQKIILSNQHIPPLSVTVKGDLDHWKKLLGARHIFGNSLVLDPPHGFIKSLPGYEKGEWWVQDPGASLPVFLFDELENATVLDMCAAPGGKTMQMASMGAKVIAVDQSKERLKQLESNTSRIQIEHQVEIIKEDILNYEPAQKEFTHIFLDAPCSSNGAVRRHPDILFIKTQKDIDNLEKIQKDMLEKAWSLLAPEGYLVYSVCSLAPKEGEEQIENFMRSHQDCYIHKPDPETWVGGKETLTDKGFILSFPYLFDDYGGIDGFFSCALRKKPS